MDDSQESEKWEISMNKWVIIGALGNLLLCVLNIVNLVRHW